MNFLSFLSAVVMSVTSWTPVNVSQFWVEPEKPSVILFNAASADQSEESSIEEKIPYEFKTTDGEFLCRGEGVFDGKLLRVEASLPQGFFELELPQTEQTFGVASQPAFCPDDA
ncbi:MAG: hypothetical protein IKX88_12355, partial [Thermoguttaceae bacterium]|nr:hypothetical protein [Thermoguttaceae bacterium]